MKKQYQPFDEFGGSLSISFSGVDVRTADGKRVLGTVYGEIARFILACRSGTSFTSNQYDGKSITRSAWSAQWSKISGQEHLRVQLRGSKRVEKKEKKEEKVENYTVMVVFHEGGKITCFDMNSITAGSPGVVVFAKTLQSSWTLREAINDVQQRQFPHTIQMKNEADVGSPAVSMLKIRDNVVELGEVFQLHQPTNGLESVDTLAPCDIGILAPSLMSGNGLIYTGVQAFDPVTLLSVNDDVWAQAYSAMDYYGFPGYIDSDLRAYFSLRISNGSTTSANFRDAYQGIPDESGGFEITFRVAVGGGRTDIGSIGTEPPTDVTSDFPRAVFRQETGLDYVDTHLASVNWTGGDSATNAIVYYDGTLLQDTNEYVQDIPITPVVTFNFPYQWGTSFSELSFARGSPPLLQTGYGFTYNAVVNPFGGTDDNFRGTAQVSNGLHYLQGYIAHTDDTAFGGTLIEARYFMDGVDCTEALAGACGCPADKLEFFFMDVPLWRAQVLV